MFETYYDLMRRQGISRRSFVKFCSLTAASLGLGEAGAQQIATAMQTKPRTPVIWLHGLECTCCSESFIRSAHPLAKDVVLSMISLDYDDTLMAAAGHQAEAILQAGGADMIAMARGILNDPHWPWHAAEQLGHAIDVPFQYRRAATRAGLPTRDHIPVPPDQYRAG